MNFEELLADYETILININRQKRRHYRSDEYLEAYYQGASRMFHLSKLSGDFRPARSKPTPEQKEKYLFEGEEPVAMLYYRGKEIPIYNDDYGQQEFIVFNDKTFGGGAYNTMAEYDFCDYMDDIIDQEIINMKEN